MKISNLNHDRYHLLLTWKNPCFRHELAIQALQTGDQDDSLGPEKKEVDQNLVIENQMVELGLTQQVEGELSDITVNVLNLVMCYFLVPLVVDIPLPN